MNRRRMQQMGADRMAMIRLRQHQEAVEKGIFNPIQGAKNVAAKVGDWNAGRKAGGQYDALGEQAQSVFGLNEGQLRQDGTPRKGNQALSREEYVQGIKDERIAGRDAKRMGQMMGAPAAPASNTTSSPPSNTSGEANPAPAPAPAPTGGGPVPASELGGEPAPPPMEHRTLAPPPAAPGGSSGGPPGPGGQAPTPPPGSPAAPGGGPAPPPGGGPAPPPGGGPAPPPGGGPSPAPGGAPPPGNVQSGSGNQAMNPSFNISYGGGGSGGSGSGSGSGTGSGSSGLTPAQEQSQQDLRAMANQRANTRGGFGTGIVSNLLTGGLSGMARGAWNKYQRGQGKKQLQQYQAGNFTASFDDPNAATASADRILKASSHIHIRQDISKGRGMSRDHRRMIQDAVKHRAKGVPIPEEPKAEDEAPGKMCACGKGMVPEDSYTGDRCQACYDKKEAKRRGGA